jgi:acyl-CoA thioester hydrolase
MSIISQNNFLYRTNVRIDDINFGNHLCHTKYINILHNARALFLKSYHVSEVNCFGPAIVLLNLNIDYMSQCYFDDILEISVRVETIEKVTSLISYSIHNITTKKQAARATTLLGFIDLQKNKLTHVPNKFRDLSGLYNN